MDKAKARVAAAACALFFGLAGVVALAFALTILLAESIGLAPAVSLVAVIFLGLSGASFIIFLIPGKPIEKEIDQLEDAGASALADLPVDALKTFVQRRPATSIALALFVGYTLVRDPETARKHIERALISAI